MRAISQRVVGGPEVLELVETERPAPGLDDVLIEVYASSVNPVDRLIRAGAVPFYGEPPFVLGYDVSGVVVDTNSTRFQTGAEVYGMPGRGCYAEYVVAPAAILAAKPRALDHAHAGALPAVGLTAWQALRDVHAGQRVLIHAAGGGVGHAAVQIAKAKGAYVLGTARATKHDFLRGLGADELIDYTTEDFAVRASSIDVVLDLIGEDYGPRSLDTLAPGGTLVTAMGWAAGVDEETVLARGFRFFAVQVQPSGDDLEQLAELVDAGNLTVHVEQSVPLPDAAKAHEIGERGGATGKIAITVRE